MRHLKQRDEKKLDKLLNRLKQNADSHQQAKFSILQDIYGCRTGGSYEFGLADAFNKEDLEVKLASLQSGIHCGQNFFVGLKKSDQISLLKV